MSGPNLIVPNAGVGESYRLQTDNNGVLNVRIEDAPPIPIFNQIAPLGTGADDWPRLIAFINARVALGPIEMLPGVWHADSDVMDLPSGTVLYASPGVTIIANLPFLPGGPPNSVFRVPLTTDPPNLTTITADTVIGGTTIALTDITHFPDGTHIILAGGADVAGFYRIVSHVANVVTVDRPILRAYPVATSNVVPVTSFGSNVQLYGRGALITGQANRAIEMVAASDCIADDWRMTGTFGDAVVSMDVPSLRCRMRKLDIQTVVGGGVFGMGMESCEDCSYTECYVRNTGPAGGDGIGMHSCLQCLVDNCTVEGFQLGCVLFIEVISTQAWAACVGNTIRNCKFTSNSNWGIAALDYANHNFFTECIGTTNGFGLFTQQQNAIYSRCENLVSVNDPRAVSVTSGYVTIQGWRSSFTGVNTYVLNSDGSRVELSDFLIELGGGGCVGIGTSGATPSFLRATNGRIVPGVTFGDISAAVGTNGTGEFDLVDITGGYIGFFSTSASSKLRAYRTTDASNNPYYANVAGTVSRGTFQLNGATPVVVPFIGIRADDQIAIEKTINVGGGTAPVITITAGTGFTATGVAGDTSTYAWRTI